MQKTMRALLFLVALGVVVFLTMYTGDQNMGVLNPKGIIASAEKDLLITSVILMLIVIIPVFIMLFAFAWRYRASNTKAKYAPDWHSNLALEIIWWAIPICIVAVLAYVTWESTHRLEPSKPLSSKNKPVIVEVIALDWKWLFIYPEEHIATVNFLEIPKDTPINFKITSDAPMNAFWIPQLGSQIYAMAGMTAKLHLMASEEGVYKGISSNFSGDGFSGMRFDTKVVSGEEYVRWVNSVRTASSSLTEEKYTELLKRTKNHPVEYFSSVVDGLYDSVIMKFMAPGDSMMNMGDTKMDHGSQMHDMNQMHSH